MVAARPYKLTDTDEYHITRCENYCPGGTWSRDWAVGLFDLVGHLLLLAASVFFVREAHVLKFDQLRPDGNYNDGLIGWTLLYTAFILMAISEVVAIVLTVTAYCMPGRNIQAWWPDGDRRSLARQVIHLASHVAAAVFTMAIMSLMARDFSDLTDDMTPQDTAARRTIQWQLFYGVDRFAADTAAGSPMTYDHAIVGMTIVFAVRTAYILVSWFLTHEKPFYLFPFCLNRATCTYVHPSLGGEDDDAAVKTDAEYVECRSLSCGGFFSGYLHNQLGAVRNHLHLGTLLYLAAFAVLAMHNGGNADRRTFAPSGDTQTANNANVAKTTPCAYENNLGLMTTEKRPDTWKNCPAIGARTWDSAAAPDNTNCLQPSLYAVQDYRYFNSTTANAGRIGHFMGLRMNQLRCNPPVISTNQTDPAGYNKGGGVPEADVVAAYLCCPGSAATSTEEDDDTGHAMIVSSYLLLVGSILYMLASAARVIGLSLYGISAVPSDVPRNENTFQFMPC